VGGDLGLVVVSEGNTTQTFRLVSDGWTVLVVLDDL